MTAIAACPRCLWERTAAGGEAAVSIAIALRAHYEVWHPAFDPPAPPPIVPGPLTPRPHRRPAVRRVHAAPAAA